MSRSAKRPLPASPDCVRTAARWIRDCRGLLIGAGAGTGVDSGLPDFRGPEGFWQAYPALGRAGVSFQQMVDPRWFRKAPRRAWGFYGHRLNLYRATTPHAGFRRLADWAAAAPAGGFVFTSNVDGQFQQAGWAPDLIVECHGSIHHLQSLVRCTDDIWPADGVTVEVDEETCRAEGELPTCPHCGLLARPWLLDALQDRDELRAEVRRVSQGVLSRSDYESLREWSATTGRESPETHFEAGAA